MVKDILQKTLQEIIEQQYATNIAVTLEQPADLQFGDFTTNAAMVLAKQLSANPREIASKIKEKMEDGKREPLEKVVTLGGKMEIIEKVDIAGPGFINIWIKRGTIVSHINSLLSDREKIAKTNESKKFIVEYSSPNIAKPFTIGHLRSTIIGDAIANLLEYTGAIVYRDNHVGDWGTQFGKQIYAIKTWGNEKEIEEAEKPVKILVELYVKFHEEAEKNPELENEGREWFRKLESGDPEARRLWKKCIEWSWKEFDQIYKKLNVRFTENDGKGYGEAFFEDKMQAVIVALKEKGLLKEGKDGAQLIFFPNDEYPPLMIVKQDGATLYSTRDLATDTFRLEHYGKEITIINEVGAEQGLYFRQLYALEEMLGLYRKDQRVHIKHGLYRFKEGKMSTRKGNVIWLEDVLEEAISRAKHLANNSEKSEDSVRTGFSENRLAHIVGIGALKWNDLKRSPHEDIAFDWDTILSMEGNSGPYIQYTYARTQSVIAKSIVKSQKLKVGLEVEIGNLDLQAEEEMLLRLLYRFDEVVIDAARKFSPNILANYVFQLAQQYNLFYQKVPILKSEGVSQAFRLWLNTATGEILKKGLNLLGIQAPEKM